jgi:hypothetical protein
MPAIYGCIERMPETNMIYNVNNYLDLIKLIFFMTYRIY